MGRSLPARPLILDAGALIALDDRDRRVGILVQRARELGSPLVVPVGALAQSWRDGSKQASLARLLRAADVECPELSIVLAQAAGELCGRTGTKDIIDATIVLVARQWRGAVATSDPDDLRHLDPGLTVVGI